MGVVLVGCFVCHDEGSGDPACLIQFLTLNTLSSQALFNLAALCKPRYPGSSCPHPAWVDGQIVKRGINWRILLEGWGDS